MAHDNSSAPPDFLKSFENVEAVARYTDGPIRFVPGLDALHRMTSVLLAENTPENARILVLGAGGGLELKALATAHPTWTFVGVDPAQPMLDLAKRTLGPLLDRVELVKGYIDDASEIPFDAATCLLTLHFLEPAARLRTVREIHRRLKPGAPFVAAHISFPQRPSEREGWLARYVSFGVESGADEKMAASASEAVGRFLPLLEPAHDEEILKEAGFPNPTLFYAAFTWRGWIAHASKA